MRTIGASLQTHLNGEVTTLAALWTVTRKDDVVLRFTDHDQDIVVGADTYTSLPGFEASSVLVARGAGTQGVSLVLPADDDGITEADLKAGLYEGAQCVLSYVNWADTTQGQIFIFGGEVGEVIYGNPLREVTLEIHGKLNSNRFVDIEVYATHCRADLGDERCKFDLTDHHPAIEVTVVNDNRSFETTGPDVDEDHYWALGVVHWLTGNNAGLAMEVRESLVAGWAIELVTPMPFDIQVGDTAEIWPGCDKQLSTCRDRFDNVINFHAEPFSPEPYITEDPPPDDQPVSPPSDDFEDDDKVWPWEDLKPEYVYS